MDCERPQEVLPLWDFCQKAFEANAPAPTAGGLQNPSGWVDTTPPFSTTAAEMARRFWKYCLVSLERSSWTSRAILPEA